MTRPNLVPITRQVTGDVTHRAYAFDRDSARMVAACSHRHRNYIAAIKCAIKLTRRARRGREAGRDGE